MTHDIHQWEHLPFPNSLPQFQKLFPDDAACARYLEGAKWPDGFCCPTCKASGEPFRFYFAGWAERMIASDRVTCTEALAK